MGKNVMFIHYSFVRSLAPSSGLEKIVKEGTFEGRKLKGKSPVLSYKSKMAKEVITKLQGRLAEVESLLKATHIVRLQWPTVEEREKIQGRLLCVIYTEKNFLKIVQVKLYSQ